MSLDTRTDLSDRETEIADHLALDRSAQDLLFRQARTANTFTAEPVTEEQAQGIYDLVKWAPTSMNIQPLRVVLVRSAEARDRLLPLMGEGNRAKTGTAPLVAILAADDNFHDELPKVFPHFPGARDLFVDDAHRADTASLNTGLQIGYFLLGVRAAGLAAGPMTGFDRAGVDAEFFAGTARRSHVIVNIGHPGENAWQQRLPRLSYDEVVTTL